MRRAVEGLQAELRAASELERPEREFRIGDALAERCMQFGVNQVLAVLQGAAEHLEREGNRDSTAFLRHLAGPSEGSVQAPERVRLLARWFLMHVSSRVAELVTPEGVDEKTLRELLDGVSGRVIAGEVVREALAPVLRRMLDGDEGDERTQSRPRTTESATRKVWAASRNLVASQA